MVSPVSRRPSPRVAAGPASAALALLAASLVLGGCENPEIRNLTPVLQDDSALSRDVGAALDERPELARFTISVKSLDGGTVRLSGRVDTDSQRFTAEQAAAAVPGVRSVINTLYVRE